MWISLKGSVVPNKENVLYSVHDCGCPTLIGVHYWVRHLICNIAQTYPKQSKRKLCECMDTTSTSFVFSIPCIICTFTGYSSQKRWTSRGSTPHHAWWRGKERLWRKSSDIQEFGVVLRVSHQSLATLPFLQPFRILFFTRPIFTNRPWVIHEDLREIVWDI